MTNKPKLSDPDALKILQSVITQELDHYVHYNPSLLQLGVIRAGASAAAVREAFGGVLGELMSSPEGLHHMDRDRLFWVEEQGEFFVLHADVESDRSVRTLVVERTAAVESYPRFRRCSAK